MTTPILLIDTASGAGRVGLAAGQGKLAQKALSSPRLQAEEIYPLAASLLAEHNLSLSDLHAVAVSTGPGSFTSLRVGLTAAKSLSEVAGLRLIGISNIEAVARLAPGYPAAILLPASRGEVFLGIATPKQSSGAGKVRLEDVTISAVEIASPDSWWTAMAAPPSYVLSPSADILDLAASGLPSESRCVLVPANCTEQLAAIAQSRYQRGEFDDPLALDAAYARTNDADKSWVDVRLAPPVG